jgi:hypothetical protein
LTMADRLAARYARSGFGSWARTALPLAGFAAAMAVLAAGQPCRSSDYTP